MNYSKVLVKFFGEYSWKCDETYESIEWKDTITTKPTKEHLERLWNELLKEHMRKERNKLLSETDYTALPDFPNKDMYLEYRQQLRDFPALWSEGIDYPIKPE